MHARVTVIEGQPDRADAVIEQVRSEVVPMLEGLDGFKGFTVLVDRSSGKLLATSYWETAEARDASAQAVEQSRDQATQTSGASAAKVENYEVAVDTMA
jgi:heme-degrading monooxygenase HmoA